MSRTIAAIDPKVLAFLDYIGVNAFAENVVIIVEREENVRFIETRTARKPEPLKYEGDVFIDHFTKDLRRLYVSIEDKSTRVSKSDILRLIEQHLVPDSVGQPDES